MILHNQKIFILFQTIIILSLVSNIFTFTASNQEINQSERIITYALPYRFSEFNLINANSYQSYQWLNAIQNGLFKRSITADRAYIPDLASSLPIISASKLNFTVTLKQGLRFASGESLTTDDVVFSYKVLLTSRISHYYTSLSKYFDNSSIIKIDDYTVQFNFNTIAAFPLQLLSAPIIEKNAFEKNYIACITATECTWDDETGYFAKGAGPFMLDQHGINLTSMEITLIKNPNYWNTGNVYADKIKYKYIQTKEMALKLLENRDVDILDTNYNVGLSELNSMSGVDFIIGNTLDTYQMEINHKNKYWGTGEQTPAAINNPTKNASYALSVRKAMSHAINRELIINNYFNKLAQPASIPMPNGSIGWDTSIPVDQYNISIAKQYMENSGFDYTTLNYSNTDTTDNPIYDTYFFNTTILFPQSSLPKGDWLDIIRVDLMKIGIGATIVKADWINISQRSFGSSIDPPSYAEGGFDILFIGTKNDLDYDPSESYQPSGFCSTGNCENWINYNNATTSQLIDDYLKEQDFNTRLIKVKNLQKALKDDLPSISIFYLQNLWIIRDDIAGVDTLMLATSSQEWENVHKLQWTIISTDDQSIDITNSETIDRTDQNTVNTINTELQSSDTSKIIITPIISISISIVLSIIYRRSKFD